MSGKLTTHVLDTVKGSPAIAMTIELWSIDSTSNQKTLLKTVKTNDDGRTHEPLLKEEEFKAGIYELVFHADAYFRQYINDLPQPPFLEKVPLRFGIADLNSHYHVPLLTSPWSYSTYRGS